jgi:hypothetical protein
MNDNIFVILAIIVITSYYWLPILINITETLIADFLWDKFRIDWNVDGSPISRSGIELLDILDKYRIEIYDVMKDKDYTKDNVIDTKKLYSDLKKGVLTNKKYGN